MAHPVASTRAYDQVEPVALTHEHLNDLRCVLEELHVLADASGSVELRLIFQRLLAISNFAHGK